MKQRTGCFLALLLIFASLPVKAQVFDGDFQLPLRIFPVLSAIFEKNYAAIIFIPV